MKKTEEEKERQRSFNRELGKLSFFKQMQVYKLALKYKIQGDDWLFAQEYALSIVKGFKR